jgi:hypothetical protein
VQQLATLYRQHLRQHISAVVASSVYAKRLEKLIKNLTAYARHGRIISAPEIG